MSSLGGSEGSYISISRCVDSWFKVYVESPSCIHLKIYRDKDIDKNKYDINSVLLARNSVS